MRRLAEESDRFSRVKMVSHNILRVNGQEVALGLLWQPVQEKIPLREQARMAGGRNGKFDLFVPFANGKQYGFASSKDGITTRMSAAASLCGVTDDHESDNWLAAFALPGGGKVQGYWVVARREHLIYEDQILRQEDAAKSVFLKSFEAPDWKRVIAPAKWQIDGAAAHSIEQSIKIGQKVKRLRPVQYGRKLAWGTILLVFIMVGFYIGSGLYSDYRQVKLLAKRQVLQTPIELPVVPWKGSPSIVEFVHQCEQRLNGLAISVPGWNLHIAECRLSDLTALLKLRWQRTNGRTAWIKAAATELAGREITILNGGHLAEMTDNVELPAITQNDLSPFAPNKLESLLRDRFLTLGLALKLAPKYVNVHNVGEGKVEFGYHNIHFATSTSPVEHARLLSDIPALLPISLIYQPSSAQWQLSARAFHPAPMMTVAARQTRRE